MSSLLAKGCKFEPILTLLAFQALNNEGPLWYGPSVYKIAPWTHDIHTCWRARCWYRNYFYVAARIQCLTIHKRGETSTKFAAACITNTYSLNRTFPARMPILTPPHPHPPSLQEMMKTLVLVSNGHVYFLNFTENLFFFVSIYIEWNTQKWKYLSNTYFVIFQIWNHDYLLFICAFV